MKKRLFKYLLQKVISSIPLEVFHLGNGPKLVILTYHRVLPDNHRDIALEQPGMYVSPETLTMHLKTIKSKYVITTIDTWISDIKIKKDMPKISVAITFDDGWRDNYVYAFPILKKYNVPATLFLVSNMIGTERTFWPNRLATILKNKDLTDIQYAEVISHFEHLNIKINPNKIGTITNEEINEIINMCKVIGDVEINQELDLLDKKLNINTNSNNNHILNHDEIEMMLKSGLITIGSHTCNHIRLTKSSDVNKLKMEITDSKQQLDEKYNCDVSMFCYPNGDFDRNSVNIVKNKYNSACTTIMGWNDKGTDRYLLKRIHLHEDATKDKHAFITKISGVI